MRWDVRSGFILTRWNDSQFRSNNLANIAIYMDLESFIDQSDPKPDSASKTPSVFDGEKQSWYLDLSIESTQKNDRHRFLDIDRWRNRFKESVQWKTLINVVEAEEQKREKKHKNKKRRKSTSIKGTDTQFALGPKTTRRPRPMLWSTPIFMTPLQQTLGGTVRSWCWCDSPKNTIDSLNTRHLDHLDQLFAEILNRPTSKGLYM